LVFDALVALHPGMISGADGEKINVLFNAGRLALLAL
jgi:hypothetical protein